MDARILSGANGSGIGQGTPYRTCTRCRFTHMGTASRIPYNPSRPFRWTRPGWISHAAPGMSTRTIAPVTSWPEALQLDPAIDLDPQQLERIISLASFQPVLFLDFSPDGSELLLAIRKGSTHQLFRVSGPGQAGTQLTFLNEPVLDAAWTAGPGSGTILYAADSLGDEAYQLHRMPADGGEATRLTDGSSRHISAVTTLDGSQLACAGNGRNGRDLDVLVADLALGSAPRPVLSTGGSLTPEDWNREATALLVKEYRSIHDTSLWIVRPGDGESRCLAAPGPGTTAYHGGAKFHPDGRSVLMLTDRDSEFRRLAQLDLSTGEWRTLDPVPGFDIEALRIAPDGSRVAVLFNQGGASKIHLMDLETGEELPAPQIPLGTLTSLRFSPDGTRIAYGLTTPSRPGDAIVHDLQTGEDVLWAGGDTPGWRADELPSPRIVTFPTFDSDDGGPDHVPAYYYPAPAKGGAPAPVVLHIHGGPESQWRPRFDPRAAIFSRELGTAMIAPNVRGSSGYGRTYCAMDDGFQREDSVRDIGAVLDWIGRQEELDSRRVAVHGVSYGGYMVLASLIHHGSRLAAGIEYVGIANFLTFLKNTKPYRQDLRRVEYGDERQPEMARFLERISPTSRASEIDNPLLVFHGANDPRVPASEAEQICRKVRSRGRPVWSVLARNEGHRFLRKENINACLALTVAFLQENLLDATSRG